MAYQVDFWSGDLHQRHAATETYETWPAASEAMQAAVEAGLLCNVLHPDFKAPAERVDEAAAELRRQL